jgi:methylase of polypeptide subunit release factors
VQRMSSDVTNRDTETDFGGLSIRYDERVLEPRSWTTAQAQWAADLLRQSPPGPVLELCAGAGHIGLLTVHFQPRDLVMVDLNPAACELARANVAANPVGSPVDVREGPMDEVLGEHERFVGVIADPPWVASADVDRFPADPLIAIDGGADGMAVAWVCLDVIARHLLDDGWAVLQLGTPAQVDRLQERLAGSPGLRLDLREVREYGDRGVLVLLRRSAAQVVDGDA